MQESAKPNVCQAQVATDLWGLQRVVCKFLPLIHEGMDDELDGLWMKGAGPMWQGHVPPRETIAGNGIELRVLIALPSNADK